jgi:long-chain acyl-CoA synthetase
MARGIAMSVHTINELFYSLVERDLACALMVKRPAPQHAGRNGMSAQWTPISSRELYRNAVGVAHALEGWGIGKGDRVAILSENRPEWAVADFATMLLGAITTPIYTTLAAEQTLHLLRDSGARAVFVSSHDHLRKLIGIKDQCAIERIVLMDCSPAPAEAMTAAPDAGATGVTIAAMDELMRSGPDGRNAAFDARALAVGSEELATIIYTSGTTGVPKGAMLTHGNLACNLLHSFYLYPYQCGQVSVSFMPLSHVYARHVDYVNFLHGVTVAYCSSLDDLLSALQEVRPHTLAAVPRVFEKLHNKVRAKFDRGIKRKIYDWAISVGSAHREEVLDGRVPTALKWLLADKLFYSKIRAALGGRVDLFICGGAPLNRELLNWYASIGIRVMQGYGLTETAPIVAVNNVTTHRWAAWVRRFTT